MVTPHGALELRKALSPDIIPVGVFVNAPISRIVSLVNFGTIDAVQLHEDEDEEYIMKLKAETGKKIIKAVPVINTGDAQKWPGRSEDQSVCP